MEEIKAGDRIESIVDRRDYKKGDQGVCLRIGSIECETYLSVKMDNGISLGPILSDSWKVVSQ